MRLLNTWVAPVTVSPVFRPVVSGVSSDAVVPSYSLVSVTAAMVRPTLLMVPVAVFSVTV